jgi:UPF0176 protein
MKVVSFYRFLNLDLPLPFRDELQSQCEQQRLLGTILVSTEGFNGSISGDEEALRLILRWIENRLLLSEPIDGRWNDISEAPFRRMRVRIKEEIVSLGRPDILPHKKTGTYVPAAKWNALIEDPNVLVIDTRNSYEVEIGTFPRAINPDGIRCEKATALMLELGFDEVYHLQGGILKYLEDVPGEQNRWDGECFVFDTRVAVDRDLEEGGYVQCHACRRPLGADDIASPDYREGVSCPQCIRDLDGDRATRLAERQKQVTLAEQRGEQHIGQKLD